MINRRISIAPMMDWTDRHDRYFLRLISQHAVLYTEMVTCGAILHGDKARFLKFHPSEQPVAIQLGGSNPVELAECAKISEDFGYSEINLNVGCPSDRVQSGKIGACLMAEPELVAECLQSMADVVSIPVTVKHRIGIDDEDSYESLHNFVNVVKSSGCKTFIVHARKAILSGLSPKQNRDIPPLEYHKVYQLKKDFPDLEIIINGGIKTLDKADEHLQLVDGVMIGREAYHNPYILSTVDQRFYSSKKEVPSRIDIVERLLPYIESEMMAGARLQHISRHILGLFHAQPRGKQWRRLISESAYKKEADIQVILDALKQVNGEF